MSVLDLHVHTNFSFDSLLSPRQAIASAKKAGLNGIAITDHGTIAGVLAARELNHDKDFLVVIGAEIDTEDGQLIGLFLQREIQSKDSLEVVQEIREQGGIVVLPHPCHGHRAIDRLLPLVDALEVFNARCTSGENLKAQELREIHNLPAVAGSDAHWAVEIGLGCYETETTDEEALRQAILSGKGRVIDGNIAPRWVVPLSQLVKAYKFRQFGRCPRLAREIVCIGVATAFTRMKRRKH